MIQPLNLATLDHLGQHSFSWLQCGFEALETKWSRDTFASGNFYIYDRVEQHNLNGSCSIASILGYLTIIEESLGTAGLIHPDDLSRIADHFQQFFTLRYGEVIRIEYRMRQADGRWCWLCSQETPLVMAIDGIPLQILGIVQFIEPTPELAISIEQNSFYKTPQCSETQYFTFNSNRESVAPSTLLTFTRTICEVI